MRLLFAAISIAAATEPTLLADDSWVGQFVMPRKPTVILVDRVGGKEVRLELKGIVQQVLEEKDGKLLIHDAIRRGVAFAQKQDYLSATGDLIQAIFVSPSYLESLSEDLLIWLFKADRKMPPAAK
jgi:hypothetical protein